MCCKAKGAGLGFSRDYMYRRIDPNLYGELRKSMKWYYKPLGSKIRSIGASGAGEKIHFSAKQRIQFATESVYRESPDRENLRNAIENSNLPIAKRLSEEDFHNPGTTPDWNDGGGSAKALSL